MPRLGQTSSVNRPQSCTADEDIQSVETKVVLHRVAAGWLVRTHGGKVQFNGIDAGRKHGEPISGSRETVQTWIPRCSLY